MKKTTWITIVTVLLMTFTTGGPSTVFAKASFNDIAGHWAEGEIEAAVNYGYISGYPDDGTFRPEVSITRAEFVKIINYARNYTEVANIPFTDVPVSEWYYIEIQKAYSAGYIQGDEDGKFRPTANISRQEVAVILERFTEGGDPEFDISRMRDAGSIASWAISGVKKAFSLGYVSGDDQAMFNPTNPLKRCEAVKIINRVLGLQAVYISGNDSNSGYTDNTGNNSNNNPSNSSISITNFRTTDIGMDEVRFTVTSNKDGIIYWVLMPDSNISTPSVEQVVNGRASNGSSAYRSGDIVVYSGVAKSERIYNIEPEDSYKLCAVAVESDGTRSAVSTITFNSKSEGDTGEEWINTFKVVSGSVNSYSAEFTFTSSKVGTLYWVLVYDSSSTPSQANIRNGYNSSGSRALNHGEVTVSARSTAYTFEVTDLEPSTAYKVYACVYDNSDDYSVVRNDRFTSTGSSSSSNWLSSITTPSGSNLTSETANATANFTVYAGSYRFYWMLVDSAATRAPTASEIRDHTYTPSSLNSYRVDWSPDPIPLPSSGSLSAGKYPIELKALTPGKSYRVYGVVYSGSSYSTVRYTSTFTTPAGNYASNLNDMTVQYGDTGPWTNVSGYSFAGSNRNYMIDIPSSNKIKIVVATAPGTTAKMAASTNVTVTSTGTNEWELTRSASMSSFTATVTVEQPGRTAIEYTLTFNIGKAKLQLVQYKAPTYPGWFNANTYSYKEDKALGVKTSEDSFQLLAVPESDADISSVEIDGVQVNSADLGTYNYIIPLEETTRTMVIIVVSKEGLDDGKYEIEFFKSPETD